MMSAGLVYFPSKTPLSLGAHELRLSATTKLIISALVLPVSPPPSSRPPKRRDPSTPLPDGSYFPIHKITEPAALTRFRGAAPRAAVSTQKERTSGQEGRPPPMHANALLPTARSALLPTAHPPDTDTNATRRPETTLPCSRTASSRPTSHEAQPGS